MVNSILKYIIFVIGLMWTNYPQTAYSIGVALPFKSIELFNTIDMQSKEIWKDIKGYNGDYEISNSGMVRSNKFNRSIILKQKIKNKNGYYFVMLCKNSEYETVSIHRLLAIYFIPNPENKRTVNHINGIKTDNQLENLEWCTYKENINHAFSTGLNNGSWKGKFGKDNSSSIPIIQYSQSGELITTFYGQSEAQRITGINSCSINMALKGKRKTAGGYIWKYK